jgi:RimJ/RimL family protein N-acetyltransferase
MAIETERLVLTPFLPVQLLALVDAPERFESVGGVAAAPGLREFMVSGEVSPVYLQTLRAASGPDPWAIGFAIVHRADRVAIGACGFKGAPCDGHVEIAYGIVPTRQGQGFATEAARALVGFALADGRVGLVLAHTAPQSNASTRVLRTIGFRTTGQVVDPEDGPVWRWEYPRPTLAPAPRPEVVVRRARSDDAAGVIAVFNPIIEGGLYSSFEHPFTEAAERAFIEGLGPREMMLVAVESANGRIVGFQSLSPFATYTTAFDHVGVIGTFVDLERRGQGIASHLFPATFAAARAMGYEKIFTFVRADNPAALATYEKHGFVPVGTAQRHAKIHGKYVDEIAIEKWL